MVSEGFSSLINFVIPGAGVCAPVHDRGVLQRGSHVMREPALPTLCLIYYLQERDVETLPFYYEIMCFYALHSSEEQEV